MDWVVVWTIISITVLTICSLEKKNQGIWWQVMGLFLFIAITSFVVNTSENTSRINPVGNSLWE